MYPLSGEDSVTRTPPPPVQGVPRSQCNSPHLEERAVLPGQLCKAAQVSTSMFMSWCIINTVCTQVQGATMEVKALIMKHGNNERDQVWSLVSLPITASLASFILKRCCPKMPCISPFTIGQNLHLTDSDITVIYVLCSHWLFRLWVSEAFCKHLYIHPLSIVLICAGSVQGLEPSSADIGWGRDTPWRGCQSITRLSLKRQMCI